MEKRYCKSCRKNVSVRDAGVRLMCIYCGEWCRESVKEDD